MRAAPPRDPGSSGVLVTQGHGRIGKLDVD
jgi:hypothetical protein